MRERKTDGIYLREWGGAGVPLLLTHGMAAHSHWWDPTAALWNGTFQTAALDFRGHGESDWKADGIYTSDTWIEDIETARKALGWERFLLCGHSMGARMALDYAERHPQRIRGVVAVDFLPEVDASPKSRFNRARGRAQPLYPSEENIVSRFRLEPGGTTIGEEKTRALGRRGVRPQGDGWTWKFDWRCLNHYHMSPVWPQLSAVRVPALLVRGELSVIISREDLERVRGLMPDARALEIPGAHHHVPLDAPQELAAAVTAFAAELPP